MPSTTRDAKASPEALATVRAGAKLPTIVGRSPVDPKTVQDQLAQCDAGKTEACRSLGIRLANADGVDRDDAKAVALLTKACDKQPAGCEPLGEMKRFGRGGAVDEGEAARLFEMACKAGDGVGCANLGELYATGRGVAKDEARAIKLYTEACTKKANLGCYDLGSALRDGVGIAKDERRYPKLFEQACNSGDAVACFNVAVIVGEGSHGITRDAARSTELFRQACNAGDASGCFAVATDLGKAGDTAGAIKYLEKACDGADPIRCYNLGHMYDRTGNGVWKSNLDVAAPFQLACANEKASPDACTNLGAMYFAGDGIAKDQTKGIELYKKGCDGGTSIACGNLGDIYANGLGVPLDMTVASQFYERACKGGDVESCGK